MKIAALILSLTLMASPCFALEYPLPDSLIIVASNRDGKKNGGQPGGKVVISGKGGKVTDVKKPKGKKSK